MEKYLSSSAFQELSPENKIATEKSLALLRQLKDFVDQGATDMDLLTDIQNGFEEIQGLIPDWLKEQVENLLLWLCIIYHAAWPVACFY